MQVGDLVEAIAPYQLRSGCSWYAYAVVASIEPFAIISPEGDMLWRHTIEPKDVAVVGKANAVELKAVMKRWKSEKKDN